MELDSSLMLCAVAIGAAQVVDGFLLRSARGQGTTATAFSVIEWAWGGLCVYLLVNGSDSFPAWLAGIFVAQLAAWMLYVAVQAKRGRAMETFKLTRSEALAGGVFGALYAAASLAVWAGLGL
ncbi:hypothetical protein [Roseateles sp. P5_E7]